ncbi:MAG: hypothetical protein H0X25_03310 [Acidobacteriales bacterium]|nr:hypothetical protein [Terriglobales bacterium]
MKTEAVKTEELMRGGLIVVRAFGGRELTRRVVGTAGDVVCVCCDEEWQQAEREGREPSCIGFRLKDVKRAAPGAMHQD